MPKFVSVNEDLNSLTQKICDNTAEIAENIVSVSGSVTRPADTTAYASGDLVANSTTAGSVVPITLSNVARVPAGDFKLKQVVLSSTGTVITNGAFRIHFYTTATITFANGDNGAWSTNAVASYLGSVDVTLSQAFTDGVFGIAAVTDGLLRVNLSTGRAIYAVIEARGAYTPASAEVFTVKVLAAQK